MGTTITSLSIGPVPANLTERVYTIVHSVVCELEEHRLDIDTGKHETRKFDLLCRDWWPGEVRRCMSRRVWEICMHPPDFFFASSGRGRLPFVIATVGDFDLEDVGDGVETMNEATLKGFLDPPPGFPSDEERRSGRFAKVTDIDQARGTVAITTPIVDSFTCGPVFKIPDMSAPADTYWYARRGETGRGVIPTPVAEAMKPLNVSVVMGGSLDDESPRRRKESFAMRVRTEAAFHAFACFMGNVHDALLALAQDVDCLSAGSAWGDGKRPPVKLHNRAAAQAEWSRQVRAKLADREEATRPRVWCQGEED